MAYRSATSRISVHAANAGFAAGGMLAGLKDVTECIKAFSGTDLGEDLKGFDVHTIITHGDDDRILPLGAHNKNMPGSR